MRLLQVERSKDGKRRVTGQDQDNEFLGWIMEAKGFRSLDEAKSFIRLMERKPQ